MKEMFDSFFRKLILMPPKNIFRFWKNDLEIKQIKQEILFLQKKIENLNSVSDSIGITLPELGSSQEKLNKRQTLILGYYGANNFGDELMLASLLEVLREKNKNSTDYSILVVNEYKEYNYKQWECKCFYPPTSLTQLENAADFFDELIIGGGAHIDDLDLPVYSFIPYLAVELSLLMLERSKNVNWLAVSSNSILINKFYIEKLSKVIANAQEFSVRDLYTFNTLREAGIDSHNITIREDLSCLFEFDIKRLGIVINVLEEKEKLKLIISEIIDYCRESLVKDKHYGITFIPFYNSNHLDRNLIAWIIDSLKEEASSISVSILPEYTDIWSMMVNIKGCDALFSMKYHSSLIGLKLEMPVINFVTDNYRHYINKMKSLQDNFQASKFIFSSQYQRGQIFEQLKKTLMI